MNLKIKMSLLVSGLLAAAIGAMSAILLWSEERALAAGMRQEQFRGAGALSEVCRDAVINQQYLPLTNYLLRLKSSPEILEAMCLDGRGEVLGHSDVSRVHAFLDDPAAKEALASPAPLLTERADAVEAAAPVLAGANRMATARILYSKEALRRRFREDLSRARRRILLTSLPILLGGFAGAFLVTALVLRPLETLVDGVRAVARGELGRKIPVRSKDEIAWLSGEFNQMAEKLGELDRLKQDFVNSVTHDLKSPIASTRLAVEVIQDETEKILGKGAAPARLAESFMHVRERLERLTHLIGSLLDVARIESLLALDKRPVNLEELADRVVKTFDLIARQKGLELTLTVLNKIPPIPGDADKLERALSNLVGNAVKFTARGRVDVRLEEKGGMVAVSVADTGPGIPPENVKGLFSKFFRLRKPGDQQEGTGLGLAIVKGFVEAHGGSVAVESILGKGTTFTMKVPA